MAISKDEFEQLKEHDGTATVYESGTNPHTILQFLAANAEKAFPPKEIAAETAITPSSVRVTLMRLEKTGLVDHADKYWSINESELTSQRAALVSQQAVDSDRYGGYNRDEELSSAELPPNRELRDK